MVLEKKEEGWIFIRYTTILHKLFSFLAIRFSLSLSLFNSIGLLPLFTVCFFFSFVQGPSSTSTLSLSLSLSLEDLYLKAVCITEMKKKTSLLLLSLYISFSPINHVLFGKLENENVERIATNRLEKEDTKCE